MKHTVVGIDIAKRVFQLHWIEMETGEIVSKQVTREKFLEHFANRKPCLIGMEACGGSQHWARELIKLGHQVKLLGGKLVKSFVMGNKGDAADAKAIWVAVQQPGIRPIAIKTEQQQAILALHRMRQGLVKVRVMQTNALRGLLTEYGEVMPQGRVGIRKGIAQALARIELRLPKMVIETLHEQWVRIGEIDTQIAEIERKLQVWLRQDKAAKAISEIPGVGVLTATAAVACMGDPKAFRSGREFASWVGLVPGQTGTGGKTRLLGISKRGDTYLRTLLIHGARSVLMHAKQPGAWVEELGKRKHSNVVVVALANKMARTIWALLAHERAYQGDWVSVKPA
jgi:transposase